MNLMYKYKSQIMIFGPSQLPTLNTHGPHEPTEIRNSWRLEVNSPSSWTSLGAREASKVDLSPWVHPWISKGGKVHGAIQTVRRRPGNVNLLFFSLGGLSPSLLFVIPLPFYCASWLFFFLSVFSLPRCWAYSCPLFLGLCSCSSPLLCLFSFVLQWYPEEVCPENTIPRLKLVFPRISANNTHILFTYCIRKWYLPEHDIHPEKIFDRRKLLRENHICW